MKRKFCLLFAATVCISMLSGCRADRGAEKNMENSAAEETEAPDAQEETKEAHTEILDMQFLKAGRLKMLDKALKNMKDEYDFAVIDTPPNLGVLSLNAFIVGRRTQNEKTLHADFFLVWNQDCELVSQLPNIF